MSGNRIIELLKFRNGKAEMTQKPVRFGVIGIGNMGSVHARNIPTLRNCRLAAVCDCDQAAFDRLDPALRAAVRCYAAAEELCRDPEVDVVLIAVPHYFHVDMAIEAMRNGKHVLVEKPIAVHKADAERLLAESAKHPELVRSLMFNQRTLAAHVKVKRMLERGELGRLRRVCWCVTNWFRTQHYYDSGDWRASWRGEGGGVLLNQCPHQLDLFQWFFGMPERVRASAKLGKYHDIEVEDEVNAYMEYADGMTANFITGTGESPGVNRLEIIGERGLLTLENGQIRFRRNEVETSEFSRTAKSSFAPPEFWECTVPTGPDLYGAGHRTIIENVAAAVLGEAELIAPLEEGIRGLELGNAMLYSGLNDVTVTLPLDSRAYAEMLEKLVRSSRWHRKAPAGGAAADPNEFDNSF